MPGLVVQQRYREDEDRALLEEQQNIFLKRKILHQVEYYFGDINFPQDLFLLSQCSPDGWVPLSVIGTFFRVRKLTTDFALLVSACRESERLLEVSPDGLHVRRVLPFPAEMYPQEAPVYMMPPVSPSSPVPQMWVVPNQAMVPPMVRAPEPMLVIKQENRVLKPVEFNVQPEVPPTEPLKPEVKQEKPTEVVEVPEPKQDAQKPKKENKVEGKTAKMSSPVASPPRKTVAKAAAPVQPVVPSPVSYKVEFKAGRTAIYGIDADKGLNLSVGQLVVVEADRGNDLGKIVALLNEPVTEKESKNIIRIAAQGEINQLSQKTQDEAKALSYCQSKIRSKKLQMEVIDAEFQWDRRKLTYYFIADKRVDFRELVRELFRVYKTRIWMCSMEDRPKHERRSSDH